MVVLAVAILNTVGKVLVSRQYVDMTRIRIEGLLAAFPKLLGSNVEHTYVETDNVRYVYHPLEDMYLMCITNKGSNIIEDLATLQMLSKVVPSTCGSLREDAILANLFELIFAFDELLTGGGYKVALTMNELQTNLSMDSHEERLQQMIKESKIEEARATMIEASNMINSNRGESAGGRFVGHGSSGGANDGGMGGGMGGGGGSMSMSYLTGATMGGNSSGYDGGGGSSGDLGGGMGVSSSQPGGVSSFTSGSSKQSIEPVRAAPVTGLSLGGPSKNRNFLKALAAEDNVDSSFYSKASAGDGGADGGGGGGAGGGGSGGGGVGSGSAAAVAAAAAVARPPSGDVEVSCVETMSVEATREGDLKKLEVKGTMTLTAHEERAGLATIRFSRREGLAGLVLQPNPILDRKALAQNFIRPKAPTKPFPTGAAAGVLKWRFQSAEKEHMPLSVNAWPEVSGKSASMTVEYTLENLDMVLHDVCFSIPLGAGLTPDVKNAENGVARHVPRSDTLEWRHDLIDANSPSGQLEFVVPGANDEEAFFPCVVTFQTNYTYAGFQFEAAVDANKAPVKVAAESSMVVAEYTVS